MLRKRNYAAIPLIAVALAGCGSSFGASKSSGADTPVTVDSPTDTYSAPLDTSPVTDPPAPVESAAPEPPAASLLPSIPPPPAPPAETAGQASAVDKAQQYLSAIPGFSRLSLINQLVSGDSFSTADATYAVDSLNIDYNAQAVIKAKDYQSSIGGFSHDGLVQQLEAGDSFTPEQAEAGASGAGL